MSDTSLFLGCIVFLATIVGFFIHFYKKSVKSLNEQISDKQVVINELAHYAEKISNETESVGIKKPIKKDTKKSQTKAKKVESSTKKGRKPKQK